MVEGELLEIKPEVPPKDDQAEDVVDPESSIDLLIEKLRPNLDSNFDSLNQKLIKKIDRLQRDFKEFQENSLKNMKDFQADELNEMRHLHVDGFENLKDSLSSEVEDILDQFNPKIEELKSSFEKRLEKLFNLQKKESTRQLEQLLRIFAETKSILEKIEEKEKVFHEDIMTKLKKRKQSPNLYSILFPKPRRSKNRKRSIISRYRSLQNYLESKDTTTLQLRRKLFDFRKFSKLHDKDYLLTKKVYEFEKTLSLQEGVRLNFKQRDKCGRLLEKIQKYVVISGQERDVKRETFESPLRSLRRKIRFNISGIELTYILKDIKKIMNKYNVKYEILEEYSRLRGYCYLLSENKVKKDDFKEIHRIIKKWDNILKLKEGGKWK